MPVVGIAASFVCEPIGRWLSWWLEQIGVCVELRVAAYNSLQQELRSPKAFANAAACVALLNFADWQRGRESAGFDAAGFEDDLQLTCDGILAALPQLSGRLALLLCPARPTGAGAARAAAFSNASARLKAIARAEPRLSVLTAAELSQWYPVPSPYDQTADELGHVPYSEPMWCALGGAAARLLRPSFVPPLKAVVVDADYTLWQHAVGEVGPEGVVVEARHRDLQERLLGLHEGGVLLALCSKNEPADVWAALGRGATPLRREHFSAHRVAPLLDKARAVAALAAELRLGAESLLFVDDNPAECAAVRAALPQTAAWCWPPQHAEARRQLEHVWPLDLVGRAAATAEDAARAASYAAAAPRAALRESAGSLRAYIDALRVRVALAPLCGLPAAERERVAQLMGRTNQFNAWKRAPPPLGGALRCEGVAMRVSDRFGEYGLVGAALCTRSGAARAGVGGKGGEGSERGGGGGGAGTEPEPGDEDGGCLWVRAFCMSCRVLGRGVEHALLAELGRLALRPPRCAVVRVGVVRAPRNAPARAFLEAASRRLGGDAAAATARGVAAEAAAGEAEGAAEDAWEEWARGAPEKWLCFPAAHLSELVFDPSEAEAEAAAEAEAEAAAATKAEAAARAEAGGAAAHAAEAAQAEGAGGAAQLRTLAEAVGRIPVELRSVQQAMERCGCARLLQYAAHDMWGGEARRREARALLRAVWRSVLQLNEAEAEALRDDAPFAAYGGNSLLAVQAVSLARQHGLRLPDPRHLNFEMASVESLVLAAEQEATGAADGGQPASTAATALTRATILERDGRDRMLPLKPVGGIGACAAGDLEDARRRAAGGWAAAHATDKHGNTALMWAAGSGKLAVVRWLIEDEGVAIDLVNKDGRTSLMWACKNGELAVVTYLLCECNADVTIRMKDDSTAFDWAVLGGHLPTMELLVAHPKVDIHALNKFGCASVQWAAASGNVQTCRWLHSKGVDFSHMNHARHGAIVKAAWKGHDDALRWLLLAAEGPQLTAQLHIPDLEGLSVAQLARIGGHGGTADWLQRLIDGSGGNGGAATLGRAV